MQNQCQIIKCKPCQKCGTADRDKFKKCKTCAKKRYMDSPKRREQNVLAHAKWRSKNREKHRALVAEWTKNNLEKAKARSSDWAKLNPERKKTHSQTRRALKMNCDGKLSYGLAENLFSLQKGKCPCCARPLGEDYHLDHKIPLALGGSNTDENMQLLRAKCNRQKGAKHPVDFMQERGFLL